MLEEKAADKEIEIDDLLKQILTTSASEEAATVKIKKYCDLLTEHEDTTVATLIESVPSDIRLELWYSLDHGRYWPVLQDLQSETARHIVDSLNASSLAALRENATPEFALSFVDILPEELMQQIIGDQDEDTAEELIEALTYDEGQVGRYLDKNIMRVRPQMTVKSLRNKLRAHAKAGVDIVAIYVFDQDKNLLGYLPLTKLFLAEQLQIAETLYSPITEFSHRDNSVEALRRVHAHDSTLWYPVRGEKHIVGAVSLSNIVWEIQDQITDICVNDSGAEEDLFTPLSLAARMRGVWLVVNLLTAFLASWVIGWFEGALQHVVALAILMPVVASMGGIAGSQTISVAIRGLALNHLSDANIKLLLQKELTIGLLNGLIIGSIIGCVVKYWFDNWILGIIIFISIVINSLAAAASGTFIPFILKKMKVDPAISGSVILTTVTDIVGFIVFLGLGSIFLLSGS